MSEPRFGFGIDADRSETESSVAAAEVTA